MSESAKAILQGVLTPVEVVRALQDAGYHANVAMEGDPMSVVNATQRDGRVRQVWLYPDCPDDADIYAGLRTSVTLGALWDAPAMLGALTREFGGYHRPAPDADYEYHPGNRVLTLSPADRLGVELRRILPVTVAPGLADYLAANPDAVTDLAASLGAYLDDVPSHPHP